MPSQSFQSQCPQLPGIQGNQKCVARITKLMVRHEKNTRCQNRKLCGTDDLFSLYQLRSD